MPAILFPPQQSDDQLVNESRLWYVLLNFDAPGLVRGRR